jgi:CRP/FNR family transcriptional regulator
MTRPPAGCDALVALYPILAALPGAARLRLGERAHWMTLPAGTMVFDESQACQGFPFVLTGSIRVFKCAPSGRELPLYRVGRAKPASFHRPACSARGPYNARGVTESETTLLLLPNADVPRPAGRAGVPRFRLPAVLPNASPS